MAEAVGNALQTIGTDVGQVAELINGITRASQEQAEGVEQVNTAVSQIDKVTQQNAASAEESASASEELSAQAERVKSMVMELAQLVGGNGKRSRPTTRAPKAKPTVVASNSMSSYEQTDYSDEMSEF